MGDRMSKCEYSSVQEETFQPSDYTPEAIPEVPNAEGGEPHPTAEIPVEMPHLEPELSMAQEENEIVEMETGEVGPPPEEELPPNEQPLLPPASGNDSD